MRSIFVSLAISLVFCIQAQAQSDSDVDSTPQISAEVIRENEWAVRPITISITGDGVMKRVRKVPFSGETLYTSGTSDPGLAFFCMRGNFFSTASLKPADLSELMSLQTRKRYLKKADLIIGGEKTPRTHWTYKPEFEIASPNSKRARHISIKMYNAIVRDDSVEIKVSGQDKVMLVLPRPNSAFANFGAECGIGKNKDKKQ